MQFRVDVMGLENAGTIMYWVVPPEPGWDTDDRLYKFQLPTAKSQDGVRLDAQKLPDRTFRIWVLGAAGVLTHFRVPLPALQHSPGGGLGLHVAVTWERGEVKLYLNSELVETKQVAGKA